MVLSKTSTAVIVEVWGISMVQWCTSCRVMASNSSTGPEASMIHTWSCTTRTNETTKVGEVIGISARLVFSAALTMWTDLAWATHSRSRRWSSAMEHSVSDSGEGDGVRLREWRCSTTGAAAGLTCEKTSRAEPDRAKMSSPSQSSWVAGELLGCWCTTDSDDGDQTMRAWGDWIQR